MALGDYRPTDAAGEVFAALQSQIDEQIARFEQLAAAELPAFNARCGEAQLGPVVLM